MQVHSTNTDVVDDVDIVVVSELVKLFKSILNSLLQRPPRHEQTNEPVSTLSGIERLNELK